MNNTKPKLIVTAPSEDGEVKTYMFNLLEALAEQGYQTYSVDWCKVKNGIEASHVYDATNKKILTNVKLDKIADILHIRQLGQIHKKLNQLESFLKNLDLNFNGVIINKPKTILYGLNKDYLLHLQEKGFPVPETHKFKSSTPLEKIKEKFSSKDYLVKPWNGEGGNYVTKLEDLTEESLKGISTVSPFVLVQRFEEGIYKGERSLIYLGNRFSHGVIKIPKSSTFMINESFQPTVKSYAPTKKEIDLGFDIKEKLIHNIDFFRLDVVPKSDDSPTIMEVEMVNPAFYTDTIGKYGEFVGFAQKLIDFYTEVWKHA